MESPTEVTAARARKVRWLVWSVYAALWTTALIVPIPDKHSWGLPEMQFDLKFFVAKSAHLSCYALFAMLTGWLRAPRQWRWLLMFVLMGHATLTEMIQEQVGRGGALHDVALDHVGIAVGLVLTWKWWRD